MGMAATKQEAFWEACGFGRIDEVEMYLTMPDIDVNWKSYTHNSCAIHVASQGKKQIVQMLLDAKCDVNARDDRENNAVHHAAMKGHGDIIRMLLKAGADVDAQDKNGWTPLINASYWCQPDAVKALLDSKSNPHLTNLAQRTALHELCRSSSEQEDKLLQIAEALVEFGCNLDAKCSDLGEADFTPLMFCAYHNHPKVAKHLIESGCQINSQGSNGWTALHWAADRNNADVIDVLLDSGIDATLTGRREDTALDRSLSNDIRKRLSEAMGVEYQPLEGHELKLRREALEAERKARFMFTDIPELPDVLPEKPTMEEEIQKQLGQAAKDSSVLQAMQEQMKQAQTQLRTRRLQRQRSMPTSLFRPPSPPAALPEVAPVAPSTDKPPISIFDTNAIEFIDSDGEEGDDVAGSNKNAAVVGDGSEEVAVVNGVADLDLEKQEEEKKDAEKPPAPLSRQICSSTVLEGGLVVPVMMESRGYVTTDEEDNDDDDTANEPAEDEDSGVSTQEAVTDPDGTSPMQEKIADVEAMMVITPKIRVEDEYLDEREIGDGFDEGIN